MTGYELEEVIGQNPRLLRSGVQREAFYRQMWETIEAGGVWRGELYNRRKDGTLYVEEMAITPVRGEQGEITHYVAIKQDVTPRKRQEEVIQNLATRDLLTGLPNQSVLREEIERIVGRSAGRPAASLVMLDVDRFSLLNGALGHPAGDRLLVELAGADGADPPDERPPLPLRGRRVRRPARRLRPPRGGDVRGGAPREHRRDAVRVRGGRLRRDGEPRRRPRRTPAFRRGDPRPRRRGAPHRQGRGAEPLGHVPARIPPAGARWTTSAAGRRA